ncbi:hypothetical protein E3N88_24173 [Mikania micrantha]|uniref:SBP-type domain-containing protein n=1 Tax=Mikania micrantha TaxID=192012 RepID=A0A5N6NFD5_9ASTR|nr:hypothetical protein E3N88_24173 [Mikania micrantha]
MDWVFTPSSSWDLSELDMDDFDLLEKNQTMDDYSNFGISGNVILSEQNHSTISSSSSSGLSKKPRVDPHIGEVDPNFIELCRFHSLREFDEVKRSCRKRLDGHNRRRRKARPESMCFNYGSFLTNHQGAKLLHFGGSPAYTTTTTFGSNRDREKLSQKLQFSVEHRTLSNSYAQFCRLKQRRFRFPFLLGVDSDKVNQLFSVPSSQPVFNTNASSGRLLVEPQAVLYLLSNSKHTMHHASVSGPTNNLVQFSGSLSQHSGQHLLLQNVTEPSSSHTNNQLIGMIRFRPEGLLENEAAQVLSFSWDLP